MCIGYSLRNDAIRSSERRTIYYGSSELELAAVNSQPRVCHLYKEKYGAQDQSSQLRPPSGQVLACLTNVASNTRGRE
jgi:hypothetical protein